MKSYYIGLALQKLSNGVEWTYFNNDLSTLIWHQKIENKPSIDEIENLAETIKNNEENEIIAKKQNRESAFAKLAALGLTEDEIAAL